MKPSVAFLLLMLGAVMNVQPAQEKASLLYPYGLEQQDHKNPKLDDGSSKKISLAVPFTFYGKEYRTLYVNNNGVISFDTRVNQYTPDPFPLADGRTFVAPYWGDVDNVRGGDVFYRETTDPTLLARVTKDINQYFPKIRYAATWAFVATWDHVAYYGSTTNKGNTFQAVLTTNTKTSFIILNYWDIQWTTGAASDGDPDTGLGGTPAHAGFNSGDETNFYNIPGSQTDAIINITKTSNVNVPGRWVFQVDDFKVTGVPTEVPKVANSNNCWLSMDGNPGRGKVDVPLRVWTVVLWGVFYLLNVAASAPHHLGEDFVVAFMQNGLQQTLNSDFKLLITGYSPFTSVTISMKKPGLRMTVQATTGQTILVKIPPQAEMVGSKTFDNTVVVRANNAISLVMVNEKPTSVDSAVVYPVHNWGTEYHVVTPNVGTDRYGEFVVAAWDEPTVVDVHLKAAVTYQGRSYPRGSVLPIRLEPFQAAQLQSPSDMSGTRIVAQKPVAVFTGHTCLARFAHCDHLVEQLQPVSSWGTTFIVPPLPFETQSDIIYVSTSQPTRVESQHGVTKSVRELRPSRSTLYGLQALNTLYLSANAGVQVIFFADGGNKDAIFYDPFFMTIPDVSSYCHSYKIFALEGYDNYALLIAKTSETSGMTLNKMPLRNVAWKPVPGTDYSWAGQSLGSQFAVHTVEHKTSPFGLLSVGIREQKAYGSAAVCDSDPCQLVKCRAKETCKMEKGEAVCVHDYMGTCMGSQSLQYHTFDGMTVDIRGGCTYTIAKYCGNDPTLVPFVVEEKKSEGDFKAWLTNIYVYSYNISIHIGEGGKIQVNNKPTSLPATLEAGKIQISQNEGRTILQTDFGLQVTYDEDWAVMVAVPSSYFGGTCGLCGNFNEDSEDEMTLSDGTQASSVEDWAESWRDPSCQDDCEDQETLQDTAGCAQRCPKNSHFEACGTACPATCTDPKAPASCSEPCTASCQCDEGFVLRNDSCVPVETCGCFHNGRSYKVREEFWEAGSCQSRCRCEAGGKVACKKAGCKAHEKCVTVDGVPKCQANKYFTCIGTGDPHYTTFDGLKYDFQGTCVYQFAALCTQDPKLVPFTVKVENNNRGSKAVSFTKAVTLEVYGNVISMSQEHPRKVKVNGAFVELPFTQKGQFELYHSGVHGFVRTAFGLRVSFDWYSYARVILPDDYAGAVCGLCGNANGNADDDFVTRDGKRAADEIQLANSWKVGDVPGCSAGCVGDCPVCDEKQKRLYRGDGYCGVIARAGGPFRACHDAIDPAPFLEDCAFDACHYKGHRDTLCKAIAAYVTECQSRGINVEQWRTPSFCGASCPPHSHYELCGSSCPATCRVRAVPEGCASVPCTEGCFCDEGFVLSGDECVPAGECGCEHRDRYYKKGEDFYASCRERCRCKANGVVECEEVFCGAHEECRVEDGVLGCYPAGYGRLVVSGDPHYVTFDGRAFDLQGSCTYVLARLCKPERRLTNFSVLLEHDMGGRGNVALMKKVVVSIHGYTVSMERGRKWEVTVDGERYTLPLVTEDKKLRIGQEGNNVVLQSAAGLRLLYNVATYLLVTIPDSYRGRVCGLGGNYNGDPGDDFQLPGGSLAQSTEEFITSWKVPAKDGTCTNGCDGKVCPVCDAADAAPYGAGDSCGLIRDPAGPFGPCHPRVSPVEYFNHCVHDVCAADGARDVLCHSLQAYVAACQAAGAEIGGWRTTAFCPLSCPPHSHYELCTRTCDFTCASLSVPAPCSWTCFEGCQCDDGYLFDGEACVSLEQCGCMHQGRYFKAGETIISSNCSKKCNCHLSQGLVCEDIRCPPDEVCATRDGVQRCVKREGQCRVSPGASLTTFDGAGGRLLASGTYKVTALCNEQSPNWFKVVVDVSECRDDSIPAAVAVFIFFREAFITVNNNMEVWVNGLFTRLPSAVSKAISLSAVAGNITVSHTSGMDVLFSPSGEVTVTVGAALVNQLCAPCGNFNGDPSDDLKLPDGRTVRNIAEVVDAWKARDFAGCRASSLVRMEVEAPVYPMQ
ncbi:IgGFc-binding protein-like [Aquila chrysaetos chrysaetos]|nr:IgGFc-binding protein-like [Aquila chrysaetos chrysaetos]